MTDHGIAMILLPTRGRFQDRRTYKKQTNKEQHEMWFPQLWNCRIWRFLFPVVHEDQVPLGTWKFESC